MVELTEDLSKSQKMRKDAGKVRMDLVPAEWIIGLAEVCTMGAEKYEPWLWTKGMPRWRLIASNLRHTYAWIRGEHKDAESGLDHRLHAAWNLLVDYSYDVRRLPRDLTGDPAAQGESFTLVTPEAAENEGDNELQHLPEYGAEEFVRPRVFFFLRGASGPYE